MSESDSIINHAREALEKQRAVARDALTRAELTFAQARHLRDVALAEFRSLDRIVSAMPGGEGVGRGAKRQKNSLASLVASIFKNEPERAFRSKQVYEAILIVRPEESWHRVRNALNELERRVPREVERIDRGLYQYPRPLPAPGELQPIPAQPETKAESETPS